LRNASGVFSRETTPSQRVEKVFLTRWASFSEPEEVQKNLDLKRMAQPRSKGTSRGRTNG
jgi:hypothetical protein